MLFRKKIKKYVVQVPRQGGSLILGNIEAKDLEDAINTLPDMLLEDANNPAIRRARFIHLIEADTGARYKVKNPHYDPKAVTKKSSKTPSPEEIQTMMQLDILDAVSKSLGSTLPTLFKEIMTAPMEMMKEMSKKMVENAQGGSTYDNLYKLGMFIQSLISLAKNKDQVRELIKAAKEEGLMDMLSGLKGGENVESSTEASESSE